MQWNFSTKWGFFFISVFIECSHVKWCHIDDNLQTQPKLFPFLISMEFSKIKRKHPSKMFHSDYLILLFHAIPIYASCTVYNTLILIYMFRVSFFYFHFFFFFWRLSWHTEKINVLVAKQIDLHINRWLNKFFIEIGVINIVNIWINETRT